MDSRTETLQHIQQVRNLLNKVATELLQRGEKHDQSKLEPPELPIFDIYTEKLRGMTYGSDEYKEALKGMGPALLHHYQVNKHHPEFHMRGVSGMTLVDLIEMFCDWLAATKRHADGDIRKSIEHNRERFQLSGQLVDILLNTVAELE